jgi:hypothetical protein
MPTSNHGCAPADSIVVDDQLHRSAVRFATSNRMERSSALGRLRPFDVGSSGRSTAFGIDKHRAAAFGIWTPRTDDRLCPQYLAYRSVATQFFGSLYDRLWPGPACELKLPDGG